MRVQRMNLGPIMARKAAPMAAAEERPAETPARTEKPGFTGRLEGNPLFVAGSGYDEFPLSVKNVDFAQRQFGLEPAFVDLVRNGAAGQRYSVVYHSGAQGLQVDAYRVAAAAGKNSVFTAYKVQNPDFDPSSLYRNELISTLPNGTRFGTVLNSQRAAVPESAPEELKEFLRANDFEMRERIALGSLGHGAAMGTFFGLSDELGLEMYELKKASFTEKFRVFYDLFRTDPEYRVLKLADTLGDVGAAMLLGVITPKLWEQGTAYGIAGTISSIANVGSPLVGILGEGFLGSVVDNAVNSDKPMENLKKVKLATAGLSTVTAGCYFALHPQVLGLLPVNPAYAFVGLYATSTLSSGFSGVMSGKADYAVHDQIINKGKHTRPEFSKNFFQILGVESSIAQAVYLGSYTGTVAASSAFPGASVAMAGAGAALWAGSNFLFSLYQEKPDMKVNIEGSAFVHQGDRYLFDSGWEVSFRGQEGKILKEDDSHFSVSFDDGELLLANPGQPVETSHTRRLKDYLPGFFKPKILGEKEHWELDDGSEKITISRYGNEAYSLEKVSDSEFVLAKAADRR